MWRWGLAVLIGVLLGGMLVGAQPPAKKELLIVAPREFHAALADYSLYKKSLLPVRLVALEDVLKSSEGVDDAEKLKRYLYDAWRNDTLRYVLLVGDADVLPVRYMVLDRVTTPAYDYAFYPSDLYYSDLAKPDASFEDWNGKREGFHARYFGEVRGEKNKKDPINYDGVDYRPDVAVGRWPVSTPEEVRTVANKTVAYEKGIRSGSKPGAKQVALFAVGGWVDMRPQMDGYAEALAKGKSGLTVNKYYFSDAARNDRTARPDSKNVVTTLNSGVGLVLHAGHGHDFGWEDCFGANDLTGVQNSDRLPVILSAGCSTARFATLPPYEAYMDVDGKEHKGTNNGEVFTEPPPPPGCYQKGKYNPTGLGEQLLRKGPSGAVAYIGCNTGSQPCGLTLVDGFTRALSASDTPRLGDCWSAAIAHYYARENLATLKPTEDWYPASIFFQGMKFMLFGDPTLPLR